MDDEFYQSPLVKYSATAAAAADHLGMLDTLKGGIEATMVEAGTTLWNSITPQKMNVETEDLLARIDNDALQVYNEHPDAVHLASFIAGSAVPIGLALKGMNMLRAGSKSVNWFTKAGKEENLSKVRAAFESSVGNTVEVRDATRSLYKAMALNAVVDNVAAEAAIALSMSKHPYMEDYYKDIGTNFVLNTAIGGAVGITAGGILVNKAVKDIKMAVESETVEIVNKATTPVEESSMNGVQFLQRMQNARNLGYIVDSAESSTGSSLDLSKFTIEHLKNIKLKEEAAAVDAFRNAASEDVIRVDEATGGAIRKLLDNPKFAGFEKVEFLSADNTKVSPTPGEKPDLSSTWDYSAKERGKYVNSVGVYSPVWNGFVSPKEAGNFSTIADLNTTIDKLSQSVDTTVGFIPRADAAISHSIDNTATVQADFAKALLRMESVEFKDLTGKTLAIAPDDLATMKAVYLRLSEFARQGHDVKSIPIVLTKNAPSYNAVMRLRTAKAGFDPSYIEELAKIDADRLNYALYNGHEMKAAKGISTRTADHLYQWTYGNPMPLRNAAATITDPTLRLATGDYSAIDALEEMRNSKYTMAFKERLAKLADSEGYVLLYRGLSSTPSGHRMLESYSLNPAKAGVFAAGREGGLRMYKVHLDEIVGLIEDFGDRDKSNSEVLVMRSATRENAVIPYSNLDHMPEKFIDATKSVVPLTGETAKVSYDELPEALVTTNISLIKELQAMGMGFETIALRTGTPVETVTEIITNKQSYTDVSTLFHLSDATSIESALAPTNRALKLKTSLDKVPFAEMKATLNASRFKHLGQQLVEYELLSSPSAFTREVGEKLLSDEARFQLEQIEQNVDKLLGYGVGNAMFRSANAVLENLGPVGEFITGYGKNLVFIKNKAKESLTTPLAQDLVTVAKNDAYIIELSNAINIQAAIKGTKIYRNRKFWKVNTGKASVEELMHMPDEDFAKLAADESALSPITDQSGRIFKVATDVVDRAIIQLQDAGRELYHLKNASHKATGKGNLPDIGFWVPANNPSGKQIAYVFDRLTGETRMLMARTTPELNSFIERFKASLGDRTATTDIITKDQQEAFNKIAGRHDPMYMAVADSTMQHGGSSALAELSTTPDYLAELVRGYDYYINHGIDQIAKIQLNPIAHSLDNMSRIHQLGYSKAALSSVQHGATKTQDPGNVIKNILLGRSNLYEHPGWVAIQSGIQMIADRSLSIMADIIAPYTKKGVRTEEDWIAVEREMKAKGIINPFYMFMPEAVPDANRLKQAYMAQSTQPNASLTPRAIALMNSFAATSVLRFLELAQPLVNMLSLPILTSGALSKKLANEYGDAKLNPTAGFSVMRTMMDGVALMNSKHGEKWAKLAEEKGLFDNDWRVVNGIFKDIRSLEPGVMSRAEDLLDSKVVSMLSKPSDYSEKLVRKVSFFTGVVMAKKAYPTLGDSGVLTFARNFMDEAVGNYAAAQRPAMFQGTVGAAMSLFQTYMLTYAQRLFRQVETRNWASMARMLLTQQTIFGAASLPGFHPVSELIGARYSDDNYDLTSSTFRAFGNTTAEILLYGLPSQLVGITARGDIQPRIPLTDGIGSALPAVNILSGFVDAGKRLTDAAFERDENSGMALLEAMSLQSISRPIARWSELATGHSITSTGKLVATQEDVYTVPGIMSRIFATRPIEEIKAREAMHLDSLYGAIDRDKRQKVVAKLKSYISNGNLNQEILEELAYEYMRTGTPTGWRAAINEAIAQSNRVGSANVREHLSRNSALIQMMDDLD